VRRGLHLDDWRERVLAFATGPLLCVWEPAFRIADPERFTLRLWPATPTEWRNPCHQHTAFACYNYARWRLMLAAAEVRGPLGLRACNELMHWADVALRIRDQLVGAHYGLTFAAARRSCPLSPDDAAADCAVALIWTVDRYDRGRGWQFSTYAMTAIIRLLNRRWRVNARHPQPMQLDPRGMAAPPVSGGSAHDADAVAAACAEVLDARERSIIRQRFGLDGAQAVTLGAIAERLRLSREGVRQIEGKALEKLRLRLGISIL
jgi:RNA polymerase sigma factor (sigma-70 family)